MISAQHNVHPTLEILRRFQAVFFASAFSGWIIIPAPARVSRRELAGLTQTVSPLPNIFND